MDTRNNFRAQKKGQNARQAMMISGLSTIYRNNTSTHFIQTRQHTEPRVYFLDITLEEMCAQYPKIHQIIERGRLRPKGTELFFVYKKMEHFILSQNAIYEIRANDRQQNIHERIPVDGPVRIMELSDTANNVNIPVLVDESYYELAPASNNNNNNNTAGVASTTTTTTTTCISTHNVIVRQMTKVVKMHPKSMNAFVFILNDTETEVRDFYITTENGVIRQSDILTQTCKDDIISFVEQFKLLPAHRA